MAADDPAVAAEVLRASEVQGGLAVCLGTTDGRLEAELARGSRLLVHGLVLDAPRAAPLAAEAPRLEAARRYVESRGLCARVAIERVADFRSLPHAQNLVNLLVADLDALGAEGPSEAEVARVLAPGGVTCLKQQGRWQTTRRPWPEGTDEWTHLNHGADGNPVSSDRLVEDPYGLQWIGSQVMGWGSFSVRTTSGRVLLFWDTLLQWVDARPNMLKIEARDAFSGVLLWEEYYPFPAQERTRPVAAGERIYMLAGQHAIGIDAADGRVLHTFRECRHPYDTVLSQGVCLCRNEEAVWGFDTQSGKLLWEFPSREHADVMEAYSRRRQGHFQPGWRRQLLVVGDGCVFFADHQPADGNETRARVVGLDIQSGRLAWEAGAETVGRLPHPCFYQDGVLMLTNEQGYAGVPVKGEGKAWVIPAGGWKPGGKRRFSGFTGLNLPGYLQVDGLVWIKDRQKTRLADLFADPEQKPFKGWIGVDPLSGKIERRVYYPARESWSGRCYADVGLPGHIYADNMEIVDLKTGEFRNFRAARGQCGTGSIFGNGLVYTSPMRCVSCYPMLRGATALCSVKDRGRPVGDGERLERGPAWESFAAPAPGANVEENGPQAAGADERAGAHTWPMYRHDPLRTSSTSMPAPERPEQLWVAQFSSRTSAPVAARGKVFVAVVNEGRIAALDAETGKLIWSYVAGSRIDTPPSIHGAGCYFGCHDGAVYCLRADDGVLVWRWLAAPEHRRIVAFDRVESPWPVMGAVLVHGDRVLGIAGRLTRVDGGMHMFALDPATGKPLWTRHLQGIYGAEAQVLPQSWHQHEEHMTNNLLLAKGDVLRLYDEFGTWQFRLKDGRLEGRSHEIPQPGWPRGRFTPKNPRAAERWPWCGWDRVTAAELMAGADTYNSMAPGMHPYTRAVPKYQAWLFPATDRWGIHGVRMNKEKKFVLEPARFTQRSLEPEKMPWQARVLDLDVKSYLFTGDVLCVAGGVPVGPHHRAGQLRLIRMADGKDLAVLPLEAASIFDGLAAAYGTILVSTTDGRVYCFGRP